MQAWAESFTLCFRAEEPLTLVVPSPSRSRNSLASKVNTRSRLATSPLRKAESIPIMIISLSERARWDRAAER